MNPAGRPRLLSDADLGRAKSMRASGAQQRAIAQALDVSVRTIRRRLRVAYKQREVRA